MGLFIVVVAFSLDGLVLNMNEIDKLENANHSLLLNELYTKWRDSKQDLFYTFVIILFVENKFVPVIDDAEHEIPLNTELITKWKTSSGLEGLFCLKGFGNIKVKVVVNFVGEMILINVVLSDLNNESYSGCLHPQFCSNTMKQSISSISDLFLNADDMTLDFKNKIISPVRSSILTSYYLPSPSLLGLPNEVLHKILLFLKLKDIMNLSSTCWKFNTAIEGNKNLWHRLFCIHFSNIHHSNINNWYTAYKEASLERDKKRIV